MKESKELNIGFQEAITLFLQDLEAKGKSALTVKNYKVDLTRFTEWLKEHTEDGKGYTTPHTPSDIGRITVKDYAQFLKTSGKVAPSTANRRIISLKAFFSFLHESDVIPSNPTTDLTTKAIQRQNNVKWMTRDEVSRLFHAIETAPHESPAKKTRDKVILTLLLNCGLRVSELANLKINDLDLGKGVLTVFSGKGDKFRKVPMGKATVKAVQSWLKSRKDFSSSDYLLTTRRADRITDRGVQHFFQVLNERTGIEVTPHKCRHTFAKQIADKTGKFEVIADLCGHSSVETSRIYVTPSMKELKRAVEDVEFDG